MRKFILFIIILLTISSVYAAVFNPLRPWHPLLQVSGDGATSVDANDDGIIDNSSSCSGDSICETLSIRNSGNMSIISGQGAATAITNGMIIFDNAYDNNLNSTANKIVLYDDGNWKGGLGISNSDLDIYSGGNIRFYTLHKSEAYEGIEQLTVLSGGNVGIGTSNPQYDLDVIGNIRSTALGTNTIITKNIESNIEWGTGTNSQGDFLIRDITASQTRFYIENNTGYCGIGTETPNQKLHVVGNLNVTGSIYTNATSVYIGDKSLSNDAGTLKWGGEELGGDIWTNISSIATYAGNVNITGNLTIGDVVLSNNQGELEWGGVPVGDGNIIIPTIFDTFAGNGSDGTGPSSGSLDSTTSGKQFTDWTISSGNTVTLTTQTVHRFGVNGTLTIEGTLTGDGTGLSGGAATPAIPFSSNGVAGNPGAVSDLIWNAAGGGGGGSGGPILTYASGQGGSGGYTWRDSVGGSAGGPSASVPSNGNSGLTGPAPKTVPADWFIDFGSVAPSAGGGSGGSGASGGNTGGTGGAGGKGGPYIYIECDTLSLPSGGIISAKGGAGGNTGSAGGASAGDGGAGGGGGGGTILIRARHVTGGLPVAGTLNVTGGAGGVNVGGLGTYKGGAGGKGGDGRWKIILV